MNGSYSRALGEDYRIRWHAGEGHGADAPPSAQADSNPGRIASMAQHGWRGVNAAVNAVAEPFSVAADLGMTGVGAADVISVNRLTGEVTLWDSKYRSDRRQIRESGTFRSGSSAYESARRQAIFAIRYSDLPPPIREQAIINLENNFLMARTAGAGAARNSTFSQRP